MKTGGAAFRQRRPLRKMEVPRADRVLNDLYKALETHRRTPGQAIQGT